MRFTLAALVLGSLPGCDGPRGADPSITVRDSAGIRIVETDPDAWPPPRVWRVADTPSVEIGVLEGDPDHELFQVQGAVGLPDGGVVVAEFGARLRYYDASGAHVRTLDLEGEGPGEALSFQGLERYRGDSLLVTTGRMFGQRSLTELLVLGPDGGYGRDVMAWYPGPRDAGDGWAWAMTTDGGVRAALADGSFLATGVPGMRLEGSAGDVLRARAGVMRLGPDGALLDTVATVRAGSYEYRPLEPSRYELMLDEAEAPPVRARGMRFYHTAGERLEVDVYEAVPPGDPSGRAWSARLLRIHRVRVPRSPSTDASREAYIARIVEIFRANDDAAEREEYRKRLESLRSPDSIPAVQDLRVDALGNVWLETYQSPGRKSRSYARRNALIAEVDPSPWIVLAPEGRLLGTVLMPVGLEVFEIGDRHVLGMRTDELGVQRVLRHDLVKG